MSGSPSQVLAWWTDRHIEHTELRADRAAITTVGTQAGRRGDARRHRTPRAAAGFDGAAQARPARLLDERPPHRRPLHLTCLVSAANLTILISLDIYLGQAFLTT